MRWEVMKAFLYSLRTLLSDASFLCSQTSSSTLGLYNTHVQTLFLVFFFFFFFFNQVLVEVSKKEKDVLHTQHFIMS